MADECDRGNETAELFLSVARAAVKPAVAPMGIGICINCGADVAGDARWCDTECRADWEAHGHK